MARPLRKSSCYLLATGLATIFVLAVSVTLSTAAAAPARPTAKLSFVRGNSIFVSHADGSGISMVLRGTKKKVYFDPAWSPNGRRLAVARETYPFDTHGYDDVLVFQGSRRPLPVPSGDSDINGNPAWAPDGRKIVLVNYEFGDGGALYTARPGSSSSRAVERNHDEDFVDNDPSWSPNGRAIAFSRSAGSKSGLYLISPAGTHIRRLTKTPAFNPSWSPDGRRLVFDNGRAINVINADGSGLRKLMPKAEDPAWSPDGRTIAFVRRQSIWLMNSRGAHVRIAVRNADQPTWKVGS
jgi:Tol biopolymer transport system component